MVLSKIMNTLKLEKLGVFSTILALSLSHFYSTSAWGESVKVRYAAGVVSPSVEKVVGATDNFSAIFDHGTP